METRSTEVQYTGRHRGRQERGQYVPPVSPLTVEAVRRVDVLFDIERTINVEAVDRRLTVRRERSGALLPRSRRQGDGLHAQPMNGFGSFLDDGRSCLSNNVAEHGLRLLALGRPSWLFAGPDRHGMRTTPIYILVGTEKLIDIDPQTWFADVLTRIVETAAIWSKASLRHLEGDPREHGQADERVTTSYTIIAPRVRRSVGNRGRLARVLAETGMAG